MGTVLPSIGPHVLHDLGGSEQTVGFVIGIFSFVALASRSFSGPLADRRGRKKAVLAGLFSCGAAGFAYLLPLGLTGSYLGRILQGFGEACLYTGAAAWVVEAAGLERSGQALGYLSSGIWGGVSLGPVVGHWLGSFERAAFMQLMTALAACILLLRVPEHYDSSSHIGGKKWFRAHLTVPGIAVGLVAVHYPVVAGFLILHLAQHSGGGPAAFTAYAAFILLSRFFLGKLPDRIHPRKTFYGGIAFMFVSLLVVATGPPPAVAILFAGLLGFGYSFPWSSIAITILRKTPDNERGSVVSVLSAFYDLFVGLSSFAAGAIAKQFSYGASFGMAAVCIVAAAIAGRYVFTEEEPEIAVPAESLYEPAEP